MSFYLYFFNFIFIRFNWIFKKQDPKRSNFCWSVFLLIGLDIRFNEIHVLKINIVWFLTNFRQIYCQWKWRVTNDHNQSIKSKSKRLNKLSNRMFRMIPLIPLSMILTYMTKRLFSISRATKVRCITINSTTANMTIRSLKLWNLISTLKTAIMKVINQIVQDLSITQIKNLKSERCSFLKTRLKDRNIYVCHHKMLNLISHKIQKSCLRPYLSQHR